jgi:hypothetical protein
MLESVLETVISQQLVGEVLAVTPFLVLGAIPTVPRVSWAPASLPRPDRATALARGAPATDSLNEVGRIFKGISWLK